MTIKSSGTSLKFSEIEDEFGQAKSQYGRKMSNYRRAYDYGDMELPLDAGIPTSGSIKFSDFYSKRLNIIVDAYSGSSPVYQINAKNEVDCPRRNVGHPRLEKSVPSTMNSSKKVIIHVNKLIGSTLEHKFKGQDQVAFRTGDWNGADVKLYVGGEGLIAGGGGQGGKGGIYATGGQRGGPGNSGLGIDDTSIEVTVMASNHPLRKTSGTPGAIVGGCGGGGGGAAAGFSYIVDDSYVEDTGQYEEESNPDYDPADPNSSPVRYKLDGDGNLIPKTITISKGILRRYWSGGGGGGGGAGLPGGAARTYGDDGGRVNETYNGGGPTGIIYEPAGNWNGKNLINGVLVDYTITNDSTLNQYNDDGTLRAKSTGTQAQGGENGESLTANNLTNSGRGGSGGAPGVPAGGFAKGGDGGDGGEYSGTGMTGETGEVSQIYGVGGGTYDNMPSFITPPQRPGGTPGSNGYAVLCSQPWNNYPSTGHDASRVMGGFWQQQPKQR